MTMAYAEEDEVDWSDGSLNPGSPTQAHVTSEASQHEPNLQGYDDFESLFALDIDDHQVPYGQNIDLGRM